MTDHDRPRAPRPIPVTEAVRDLIRKTAAEPPAEVPAAPERSFLADGEEWIARIEGEASVGTGALSPANLAAVHFFRGDSPDRARREALIPRGRFGLLYEDELADLLRAARPIETDDDRA